MRGEAQDFTLIREISCRSFNTRSPTHPSNKVHRLLIPLSLVHDLILSHNLLTSSTGIVLTTRIATSMFRRLPQTLPPDPSFPPDLEQLGFFVNDKDQIRQTKNPSQKFQYRINVNERVNQAFKFANNGEFWGLIYCTEMVSDGLSLINFIVATRKIILDRLHALGLETVRLPLGAGPNDKHIPILVSKDIGSKDRVVVFLGERQMEPGVLSWRVIGDAGIKHGSMVDFVDAILNGPMPTAKHASPGIVIANPCQLLWYRGGARAVSDSEWMDMPRENGVSEALRQDREKNRVEGNRDYGEHVRYIFERVLPELVGRDVKIDVIGVEYAASAALEYLAGHCEFNS